MHINFNSIIYIAILTKYSNAIKCYFCFGCFSITENTSKNKCLDETQECVTVTMEGTLDGQQTYIIGTKTLLDYCNQI